MDSYAKMKQKRVLLYLLLSFVLNCIPLLKKTHLRVFLKWITQKPFTLHLSLGIPCVYRGFRG